MKPPSRYTLLTDGDIHKITSYCEQTLEDISGIESAKMSSISLRRCLYTLLTLDNSQRGGGRFGSTGHS